MNDNHPPWRVLLVAGLAYTLLATAVTWPLLLRVNSRMPHDLGGPLLSATLLWWNAHVTPLSATWWNGPWFHPAPGSLAFSDPRLGASLMATPLQWGAIALLGIAADTWPSHLPLLPLPAPWTADAHDVAAVIELPFGLVEYDSTAMFRSMPHRMPRSTA